MTNKLAPSLMCCDFFRLSEQIKTFEYTSTELFHVDIMDGEFVPNFTLGTDFVRQLKKNTGVAL